MWSLSKRDLTSSLVALVLEQVLLGEHFVGLQSGKLVKGHSDSQLDEGRKLRARLCSSQINSATLQLALCSGMMFYISNGRAHVLLLSGLTMHANPLLQYQNVYTCIH